MSDQQPKEHYEKKPGFTTKSGVPDAAGRVIDYSLMTDQGQGYHFTTDGMHFHKTNKTSYEISGQDCHEKEPAKVIKTLNGDIIIEAVAGDIILKGRNIRIVATDGVGEVTLTSAKQVAISAPIANVKSTTENHMSTLSYDVGSNYIDHGAGVQATSGVATDVTQGSFLGGLMNILQKFKQWLECTPAK